MIPLGIWENPDEGQLLGNDRNGNEPNPDKYPLPLNFSQCETGYETVLNLSRN